MRAIASHPLRVLVADDVQDQRDMLALLLRFWGHEVFLAHDGPSALEAARIFRPEAMLLDIGMPGMDGYEVAGRLRQQEEFAGVLLIAISGYGTQEDKARARKAGFDFHLTKPADLNELQALLASGVLSEVA